MAHPLISIITPSYNRAAFIAQAVDSVLAQGYPDFEHIIVDAVSTDDTLEILKRYPHLQLLSEPDRGMYDAINKGIALAKGDVIAWLNTDDLYPPDVFHVVARAFATDLDALALSGYAEVYEDTPAGSHLVRTDPAVNDVDFWCRIVNAPTPNGWFFRRGFFEKIGFFDPSYRLVADRQLLIRAALAGIRPFPLREVIYHYRMHPDSATFQSEDSRHPVYGPRRMAVNREDLRMLDDFLRRKDLPGEARRVMRRFHGEYAYRLVSTALYHRRWDLVGEGLSAGSRGNAFFPIVFLAFSLRRVFKWSRYG